MPAAAARASAARPGRWRDDPDVVTFGRMALLLYIAAGSAAGGVARHLIGTAVQRLGPGMFPVGTMFVNVTGSFLLGLLARHASGAVVLSPEMRAALTIGFCGGYTTFSTFGYETVRLVEEGAHARALAYVSASVLLSLVAVALGMSLGRRLS